MPGVTGHRLAPPPVAAPPALSLLPVSDPHPLLPEKSNTLLLLITLLLLTVLHTHSSIQYSHLSLITDILTNKLVVYLL